MRSNVHIEQPRTESANGVIAHEGLLTIREASQYLAVSVSTLYGWVWQRRIPFVKIGRALRFDLHDLTAFIEANKQLPRREPSCSSRRTNPCYNTRAAGKG